MNFLFSLPPILFQLKARNMKLTLATLTLVALTAATPPPEPVVHKPVPEKAIGGCYHYYVFPTPRQFKLGPPLTCTSISTSSLNPTSMSTR
ncbi:hypothetical protein NOF04DRAFT_1313297 [Fusarium oxysporum II5]|nr:hypothetical protein NOF04DRAFT_1313297 [Fusarium oxysporum II5]